MLLISCKNIFSSSNSSSRKYNDSDLGARFNIDINCILLAPSGVGKTWILTALGASAVRQGLSVVHYSMELSEHYVGARYDTVFSHIPSADIKEKRDIVEEKIRGLKGNLMIKYFPPKGVSSKKVAQHIDKIDK